MAEIVTYIVFFIFLINEIRYVKFFTVLKRITCEFCV